MNTLILDDSCSDLINTFDSGDEGLDNYLKERACIDQKKGEATTTLVVRKYRNQLCLLGYYTLKNTAVLFKPDSKLRGYPAIEIVNFAIQKEYQRQGIGSQVLKGIIYKSYELSKSFSAVTVLILSSKRTAVKFYKINKFQEMGDFLDMLYDDCRSATTPMFLNLNIR